MSNVVGLIGIFVVSTLSLGDSPLETHKKLLTQLQTKYKDYYLTVKVRVASDVNTQVLVAVSGKKKGETLVEEISRKEVTLNVFDVKDLLSVEFLLKDKFSKIIPVIIHKETAPSRTETQVAGQSSVSVNGRTKTTTYYQDVTYKPQAEIIFVIEKKELNTASSQLVAALNSASADVEMSNLMKLESKDVTEISAASRGRQTSSGRWFPIRQGKVFSTIEFLSGISDNCRSSPKIIAHDRKDEADLIFPSEVLNEDAERVTLAYFIRVKKEGREAKARAYFSLLSYDLSLKGRNGNSPICATELFLFGPFEFKEDGVTPSVQKPNLLAGLAINSNAELLSEVPLELAKVRNYKRGASEQETIKPGVVGKGQGCVKCHGIGDTLPDVTQPFPWGR